MNDSRKIPKLLHHIWWQGEKDINENDKKCIELWKNMNPDYKCILWNESLCNDLVKNYFPQYFDLFNSYNYLIQKINVIRYMILYFFGGFIIDIDSIPLKPIHEYISSNSNIIFVLQRAEWKRNYINSFVDHSFIIKQFGIQNGPIVTTDFIGSIEKHFFWKNILNSLRRYRIKSPWIPHDLYILQSTGHLFLSKQLKRWKNNLINVQYLDFKKVNPCHSKILFHDFTGFSLGKCNLKNAYQYHIERGEWKHNKHTPRILIYIIISIIISSLLIGTSIFLLKKHLNNKQRFIL